jgi:predicted XRE-type DNA-binding protein
LITRLVNNSERLACHQSIIESTLAKLSKSSHSVHVAIAHWSIMSTARHTQAADQPDPPRSNPDLDVRDLEKRTRLMRIVTRLIAVSDLGCREIARRAGLPAQKVSDLLAGRLEHLSVEELQTLYRTIDPEPTAH